MSKRYLMISLTYLLSVPIIWMLVYNSERMHNMPDLKILLMINVISTLIFFSYSLYTLISLHRLKLKKAIYQFSIINILIILFEGLIIQLYMWTL